MKNPGDPGSKEGGSAPFPNPHSPALPNKCFASFPNPEKLLCSSLQPKIFPQGAGKNFPLRKSWRGYLF